MLSGFTWQLSLPTWGGGVDVDGIACPLHRPIALSYQAWGQGLSARRCPVFLVQ
jgi:hypothetical protein